MSINACIYNSSHVLAGCITDSVIDQFDSEFESLKNRYFGDDVTPVLGIMEKSLIMSRDKMSADFLNCLKLISRKYQSDLPVGFAQDASRAYHNLVRYCCSQAVYDEVLAETIGQFREAGLDYVSSNSYGYAQDDCQFEYNGVKISIRMRRKEDLYRFWDASSAENSHAVITDGGDEYPVDVNGTPMDMAEEIMNCVDEIRGGLDDEGIIRQIVEAIGELVGVDDME